MLKTTMGSLRGNANMKQCDAIPAPLEIAD
jgi:hypothetical protein